MCTVRSFDLKLQRAYEHLNSFEQEANAWIETKPYGIVHERDPEPPPNEIGDCQAWRFRINRVSDVPERLSIIIGDCVFGLRSALDHLAFALAQAHTPGMSKRKIEGSEFPIFGPKQMAAETEKTKIGCVDPAACIIIKGLQPYHRGTDYMRHPLWQIHELNRADKHRSLAICGAEPSINGKRGYRVPMDMFKNWAGAYVYSEPTPRLAFKLNAIWARWAPMVRDPNEEVSVDCPELPVEVVFDQGGPARLEPVIPTLKALCDFVRDFVIAQLSKFL